MTHPTRYDPSNGHVAVRWPGGPRKLHSHDLNDVARHLEARLKSVAEATLADGSVISGGAIAVDPDTGLTDIEAGVVYVDGLVVSVPERRAMTLPTDSLRRIGVRLLMETVTPTDDPRLRGEVVGSRAQGEPGADRLRATATWACSTECSDPGEFFGVYTVDNGVVLGAAPPSDPVDDRLARYDREAHGHYIVSGWRVSALGYDAGAETQAFSIEEGVVNVWGSKIERSQAYRLSVPEAPDLAQVESEPHVAPAGTGPHTVIVNHSPIQTVNSVTVLRELTVTLTHGVAGGSDPLPNQSVAAITSITQGATTYTQGVDYVLAADAVDWRETAVEEPAPGSTYDVTFQYFDAGAPDSHDTTSIVISGVVEGSTVLIDYDWAPPRIDVIAVDRDGALHYVRGESSLFAPVRPRIRNDWLGLAAITNLWGGTPSIEQIGIRAVPKNRLEVTEDLVRDLFDLVAQERLRNDMHARQPTTKRGLFVDPLRNDTLRDAGIAQTGAVIDGALELPIAVTVSEVSLGAAPITLPYTDAVVVDQPLATSNMRINPYLRFPVLPATMALDPAVDEWTETQTIWASAATRRVIQGGRADVLASSVTTTQVLSSETVEAEMLRQIDVAYRIEGFGGGENLIALSFDGIDILPVDPVSADPDGVITGTFTIPADVPAGAKRVEATGQGGSTAIATFVGVGEITTEHLQLVTVQTWVALPPPVFAANPDGGDDGGFEGGDPLAQTFTVWRDVMLTGLNVKFAAIGDATLGVVAQLRVVRDGVITKTILAEAAIDPATATLGAWIAADFPAPVPISRGQEVAVVFLTDDPDHALAIAVGGQFDADAQTWVTEQPYLVGLLLSSSNNSTWTAHQDSDLTFQARAAAFTATERVVPFPNPVTLTNCSDLIINAHADEPDPATRVTVRVTRQDGTVIEAAPGQRIAFTEYVSEDVTVALVLRGTASESPVLYPWAQIIAGELAGAGDYVSRAMPGGSAAEPQNVVVTFDAILPSGAGVTVEAGGPGAWTAVPLLEATALGDGWTERNHVLELVEDATVRVRITLTGSPAARPQIRELRANVTPDAVSIITGT